MFLNFSTNQSFIKNAEGAADDLSVAPLSI